MNEFAEILNLFIANVIAYTFFAAVYGFIIYNVVSILLLSIRIPTKKHKKNARAEPQHSDEIIRKHK